MLALLLQRWHYTVDIIVAIVITWLAFSYYKDHEDLHVDAVNSVIQAKPGDRGDSKKLARETNRWYFFARFELDLVRRHFRESRAAIEPSEDDSWRVTENRRERLRF